MKATGKLVLVIILFTFPVLINAQISGTFTIGPGGDYLSFSEAVDTLISQGVAGAVEFNVISGSYKEHLIVPEITGASETNTITFQSDEGIADSVVLWDSTTVDTNFVIKLDGADFITFKNLTIEATGEVYGGIFLITGNSNNNKIIGNVIIGNGVKRSGSMVKSEASDCDSLIIRENIVNHCGGCINIQGDYNNRPENIQIIDNKFNKMWAGITLHDITAPKIIGNTIDVPYYVTTTTNTGITVNNSDGAMEIVGNRIHHYNSYGFEIQSFSGNASDRGLIANNFIYSSTTTAYTFGMKINGADYLNIYHNTVISKFSWWVFTLSGTNHVNILNNNFLHLGEGLVYDINNISAIDSSDYNNFYTAGTVASWDNSIYSSILCPDLDSLQRLSGKNVHSLNVYPMFPDPTQPYTKHPWLDGAGTPVPEVVVDIDGNPRDPSHPDIGCCEFTTNPFSTPYTGNHTIGSGGDFNGFSAAVDSLMLRGISGPVQLDVLPGSYTEQLKIRNIPGASWQDTIIIQSQSGNPEDVTLHYTPPNDSSYVIQFYGVDHISFKGMTMFADTSGLSNNYHIIQGAGKTDNIQIIDNVFSGPPYNNTQLSLILFENTSGTHKIISGNTFLLDNYNGIVLVDPSANLRILNNTFYGGKLSISIQKAAGPLIKQNYIMTGGIDLYECTGSIKVIENKIYVSNSICLEIHQSSGSSDENGLVANNFLRAAGGSTNYGIHIDDSGYLDVHYNSINIISTNTTRGRAVYVHGANSKNLTFLNNILCNTGGGYSFYVENSSAFLQSDHNDIYSTGENLAAWGGNIAPDLDSLRILSSLDENSVSADPGFISASNLHANSAAIDSMATPIEDILYDIDGELRDATHPDIGADEFIPGFNYIPVITSEPDTMAYSDSLYHYLVTATDHNADTLTFHLQSAPGWMQINDSTGLVSGIPAHENAGDTTVTILVADGRGGTVSQTYPLHVISTSDIDRDEKIARTYALYQNYPNPFNPVTVISWQLAGGSEMELSVFNLLGQKVATLVSGWRPAGDYKIEWDASDFASGVYIYRLKAGSFTDVRKMVLIK